MIYISGIFLYMIKIEKDYENILVKNPQVIDKNSVLFKQQLKLSNNRIIDVVFFNEKKNIYYLVEIQKQILDRQHAEKINIYRDFFSKDFGVSKHKIKMILMAHDYSPNYIKFFKRNHIKFININTLLSYKMINFTQSNNKLSQFKIEKNIFNFLKDKAQSVRNLTVYLDKDIASFLKMPVKILNKSSFRHSDSFSSDFFQLTKNEYLNILEKQNKKLKKGYLPKVYTINGFLLLINSSTYETPRSINHCIYSHFLNQIHNKKSYFNLFLKELDFFKQISSFLKDSEVSCNPNIVLTISLILESKSNYDTKSLLIHLNNLLELGNYIPKIREEVPLLIKTILFEEQL